MKRKKRGWLLTFQKEEIYLYTEHWEALLLLGPIWIFFKAEVIHRSTRDGLVKRGWAEFKAVAGFLMGRLTRGGMAFRDSVMIREAERTNTSLWCGGKKRRRPLDRKAPIPTTRS